MISFTQLLESLRKPSEVRDFRDKISSFDKVDTRDQSWQNNLKSAFAKYGFKPIGTGNYAAVYGHPSYPYVVKVFMKDTAYLRWLDYAKKNQNNPYVPKVKGKVVRISNNFMAVRLERLTPAPAEMESWQFKENDPHLEKVLDFFDENAKLLDLHMGNVMARGKQPVIVDPFYNYFRGGSYTIDPDDLSRFKDILVRT